MTIEVPVRDPHFIALGRVAVYFSLLEANLRMLAGSLISDDQRLGQVVTTGLSFSNLVQITDALYRYRERDETQTKALGALLASARKAGERRDTMTHSVWAIGQDKNAVTRMKASRYPTKAADFTFQQVKPSDIEEVVTEIAQVIEDVQRFIFGRYVPPARKPTKRKSKEPMKSAPPTEE